VDTPVPAKKMRWQVRVQQGTVLAKTSLQGRQRQKQYRQSVHFGFSLDEKVAGQKSFGLNRGNAIKFAIGRFQRFKKHHGRNFDFRPAQLCVLVSSR
jgi:hypothetical protein